MKTYELSGGDLRGKQIFFSGILGSSMSGLAAYCKRMGCKVAGSDTGGDPETERKLKGAGIKVYRVHKGENVSGSGLLVYSAAIGKENPEIAFAERNGIKIMTRAEFLGRLTADFPERIGIAGTHGKSTTCGMTYSIFAEAGKNALALIGAEPNGEEPRDRNEKSERSKPETVIFEACEYKRSFLELSPTAAVVLGIEKEHTDCYKTEEEAVRAYSEFLRKADACIIPTDGGVASSLDTSGKKRINFSVSDPKAEIYGKITGEKDGRYSFDAYICGNKAFGVRLKAPGRHNVSNALAATAAAYYSGISPEYVKKGLESFSGMKRRFQYIGTCGGSPVYDDYAHHPTEIRATLVTAREMGFERIVCAFQPHTFSRTKEFFSEFAEVFSELADATVFADIFAAREKDTLGVSSEMLAKATRGGIYAADAENVPEILKTFAHPGTVIITLGAGKLDRSAAKLVHYN